MGNRRDPVYSMKMRAGKKRTYFFDVRPTRSDDYFITITESKRKFNGGGYERHKLFLYKEDFNDFIDALTNTVNHVKEELMPDYDFDEFQNPAEEQHPPGGGGGKKHHEDHDQGQEQAEEQETASTSESESGDGEQKESGEKKKKDEEDSDTDVDIDEDIMKW